MDPLSEKTCSKLDEFILGLCMKAKSENLPQPYNVSIIDPEDRANKLWENEVHFNNETNTFEWDLDYPESLGESFSIELTGSNSLIIADRFTFELQKETETPKLREAAAD